MDTVLSTRFAEIVAGERRARALPTLLAAALVTALVAVPLAIRANGPGEPEAADPNGIVVDLADTDPMPLDGAILTGAAMISIDGSAVRAASFNLFAAAADEPVLSSQDLEGPVFSPLQSSSGRALPIDTTELDNGAYELFVVLDTDDGEQRTAVGFEVRNP